MADDLPPNADDEFWKKLKKIVHHEVHHHDHDHDKPKKPPIPVNALNLEGVKGRWQAQSTAGKGFMILGATTAIGTVMHGMLNVKRGLVGYDDTQTGEHRQGSVENVLFGVAETYAGAALFRRVMTGNKNLALWK